ncbi:MAG: Bax inhibitor-1/YccA family membrane protein, partial [Planctomycetota bacterium]
AATGGLALQAFVITISILIAMLALYSFRILRPSQTFVSVIKVLTAGIMITYVLSFVLSFFGMALPFVSLGSAFAGGKAALIGLGINVFILGVASMWLIIDFKLIEDRVAEGGPKYMEWYCGFALLVTLAWIYFEAVKLAFRIAILLGNRD